MTSFKKPVDGVYLKVEEDIAAGTCQVTFASQRYTIWTILLSDGKRLQRKLREQTPNGDPIAALMYFMAHINPLKTESGWVEGFEP